jgi:hypothetical protein
MKCKKCGHENGVRTSQQNKSLHQFFNIISTQLNEMGLEFGYQGIKGIDITVMYTPTIVKELVWKPIQNALFDTDSTTKLDTFQMNQIIDVISKFFLDRGVDIEFPSIESLNNKS